MSMQKRACLKTFLVCAVVLLSASGLHASVVSCSTISNFQQLVTDGGCFIQSSGDTVLFTNFTAGSLGAATVIGDADGPGSYSQIGVSVTGAGPTGPLGLVFSFNNGGDCGTGICAIGNSSNLASSSDLSIAFDVSQSQPTSYLFTATQQSYVGTTTAGYSSASTVSESVVSSPTSSAFALDTFQLDNCLSASDCQSSSSTGLDGSTAATALTVSNDINATAFFPASGSASATVTSLTETFSLSADTPEPGFDGVLAGGLATILLLCKRHKQTT
jgi:hypothetical protein